MFDIIHPTSGRRHTLHGDLAESVFKTTWEPQGFVKFEDLPPVKGEVDFSEHVTSDDLVRKAKSSEKKEKDSGDKDKKDSDTK